MKGNLWTVIVVALALALLLPVTNAGLDRTAVNESATDSLVVDYNESSELSVQPADIYEYDTLNVTQNGTLLTEGEEYRFDESAGAIDWINDSSNLVSEGDEATAEYVYRDHDQDTSAVAGVLEQLALPLGFLLMMVAVGYIVVLMGGGDW